MNPNQLIETVVEHCYRRRVSARATLTTGTQTAITVLDCKTDRIHSAGDNALTITIFTEGRYGVYSTNRLEHDELIRFIDNSIAMTRMIGADIHRSLPAPERYFKGEISDLGLYDSAAEDASAQMGIEMARAACQEAIETAKERLISVEAEWGNCVEYNYIADTQGFFGKSRSTLVSLAANCSLYGDDDDRPESFWYATSPTLDGLECHGIGTKAAQRGLDALHPRKIANGRYCAVLENSVSSKFVNPIINALSGSAIDQHSSFLQDRLGQQVFSPALTIVDDPHMRGAIGARLFDNEGVATKRREVISQGRVDTYFLDTYHSAKLGMSPTISASSVLCMESNCDGLEDILHKTDRGILITGFNGGNSNETTGEYSFGIEGFYFENGEIIHPVRRMNVTGNFIDTWNKVLYIGNDPLGYSARRIPTLAFEGLQI